MTVWTSSDRLLLREAGISIENAENQLRLLREGIRPPRLIRPATRGDGIERLDSEAIAALAESYRRACAEGRWIHFIPASGAATRLAESLGELASSQTPEAAKLRALLGDPEALKSLPKALMPFHEYAGAVRTPVEEHIREAAALAPGVEARLHFTIAPEHEARFVAEAESVLKRLRGEGLRAEVTHSFQDPSTQTLALDEAGKPFRDDEGNLVLRPGGHGALLRNLEEAARAVGSQGAAFAWIRNIDNIPVERIRAEGRETRRARGGLLQERAAGDRPTRVCGMVPNTGEPGGGPFWVERGVERGIETAHGPRLRIVESAEVDASDPEQLRIFRAGTHFNPVDLAVSLRDTAGEAFGLEKFSDPSACFVASKKNAGRALKALEWPGLWNGAMADWETHCVEIPLSQFAPVKTVADLLRPEHQEVP
jgi:hypothetical protein